LGPLFTHFDKLEENHEKRRKTAINHEKFTLFAIFCYIPPFWISLSQTKGFLLSQAKAADSVGYTFFPKKI